MVYNGQSGLIQGVGTDIVSDSLHSGWFNYSDSVALIITMLFIGIFEAPRPKSVNSL